MTEIQGKSILVRVSACDVIRLSNVPSITFTRTIILSGGSRVVARVPSLILDQTEAQRAEKNLWRPSRPPPPTPFPHQIDNGPPLPRSQGEMPYWTRKDRPWNQVTNEPFFLFPVNPVLFCRMCK